VTVIFMYIDKEGSCGIFLSENRVWHRSDDRLELMSCDASFAV